MNRFMVLVSLSMFVFVGDVEARKGGGFSEIAGGFAKKTDFVVIGIYATDNWITSSYERKIEKAVELQNDGCAIAIVSEEYWLRYL